MKSGEQHVVLNQIIHFASHDKSGHYSALVMAYVKVFHYRHKSINWHHF
jgi:hypothetical protein